MEWQIMNTDGMNGLSLGTWMDGQYSISYDCYRSLSTIYEILIEDDPIQRTVRRQMAASNIIQKDLIPILSNVEDDTEVFALCIKLLVNLTKPVECLGHGHPHNTDLPWYWDVEKMLRDAKIACSTVECPERIFSEIERIMDDAGQYDLLKCDCEVINECLLLIRNLLHSQDHSGQGVLFAEHTLFLKNLFRSGIDRLLIRLLQNSQSSNWGGTVVQLISLLYKDLVSEIFEHLEVDSSCGEESCDSSNCSQCEAAMDRPFNSEPCVSQRSRESSRSSSPSSFNKDTGTIKPGYNTYDSDTVISADNYSTAKRRCHPNCSLTSCFKESCRISNWDLSCNDQTLKAGSSGDSSPSTCSFSANELALQLTDFTTNLLQTGFSSLIRILKKELMECQNSPAVLDDSYFLWAVAFFLKFARRKDIGFENLKEVFTADVFGYLVYAAVRNGEEVIHLHKQNKPSFLPMRRLHLSVSALREMLKTLTFHKERGFPKGEIEFLENLQRQLCNMSNLRQLFLWLIRVFLPTCHSTLFLRDVIVTNHYFLLLLEEWIEKDFCNDKKMDMLAHVKQFAVSTVMLNYGHLLQNFMKNDHHVNNCIFTMMHHVAGDCLRVESLLQVNILQTFMQIWDAELPIKPEMNDLMEHVIQKFISMAEDNPLKCALQLFSAPQGEEDDDVMISENSGVEEEETSWNEEEEDKLMYWFVELEADPDIVPKLVELFRDNGMKKSKLQIIDHLYTNGWLSAEKLEAIIKSDKELQSLQKSPSDQTQDLETDNLVILTELSELNEEDVVPCCISKLIEAGHKAEIKLLQDRLLEVAYIKLDGDMVKKNHVEEPVTKFTAGNCLDTPLILYSEEEESFGQNIYTMALFDQIGFKVEYGPASFRYPRIPYQWTVPEIIMKAEMLGAIDRGRLKFDLEIARSVQPTAMTEETPDVPNMDDCGKRFDLPTPVSGTMWMKMVDHYNSGQQLKSDIEME